MDLYGHRHSNMVIVQVRLVQGIVSILRLVGLFRPGAEGRPDGIDLGVGRGIVVEGDAVGPGAEKEAEETIHGKGESISCLFKGSTILWKIHQLQFS